jgi:hypothetical protein
MTFPDTPDGRIAGHLSDGFEIVGQQQRSAVHTGRGRGRLRACMATTYYNYVELLGKFHDQRYDLLNEAIIVRASQNSSALWLFAG